MLSNQVELDKCKPTISTLGKQQKEDSSLDTNLGFFRRLVSKQEMSTVQPELDSYLLWFFCVTENDL